MQGLNRIEQLVFYIAASLTSGASAAAMAMISTAFGLGFKDALEVIVSAVSAAGTIGAVVVALRLADRQSRDSTKRDYDAAVILAAGAVDLIEPAVKRLNLAVAHALLGDMSKPTCLRADYDQAALQLRAALASNAWDYGFETISKLAPLPGNCAVRLYKGRSKIKAIRQDIEHSRSSGTWKHATDAVRVGLVRKWASQAMSAATLVESVLGHMRRIGDEAGSDLTNEELCGSPEDPDWA